MGSVDRFDEQWRVVSLTDNAALARRLYQFDLVPMGHTFKGRQQFRDEFMGGFKRAFPDIRLTVVNQVSEGDYVVSECTGNGRHTGPPAGPSGDVPPTGKSVSGARLCEVWRLESGKIATLTNYQDVSTWMSPLGLVP